MEQLAVPNEQFERAVFSPHFDLVESKNRLENIGLLQRFENKIDLKMLLIKLTSCQNHFNNLFYLILQFAVLVLILFFMLDVLWNNL